MPLWIGIALTAGVLVLAMMQLVRHGAWPPFQTDQNPPTLGETGDFFGGWANSLALVWLVVVTWLQFQALQTQRQELKLSREELVLNRQELEETREEIRRQANAAAEHAEHAAKQAEHTAAMLDIERRRMELSLINESENRLRSLLLELTLVSRDLQSNQKLLHASISTLIPIASGDIKDILQMTQIDSEEKKLWRIYQHVVPIVELFDDIEGDNGSESRAAKKFHRFKELSHLYDRCVALEEKAEATRK